MKCICGSSAGDEFHCPDCGVEFDNPNTLREISEELYSKIDLEIQHRNFLNEFHKTNNFTTTMSEAFRKAIR